MRRKPVVVVGAGISGLMVAARLVERGVPREDILILEADKVIGGRIRQTRTFIPGVALDIGAEFIHGSTTLITELAHENDWTIQWVPTWAQGDGGPSGFVSGGHGYYYDASEKRLCRSDGLPDDMLRIHRELRALSELDLATIPPERTLGDYIAHFPPTSVKFVANGYAHTVGQPQLSDVSLSGMVYTEKGWENDGDGDARLQGSFGVLVDHLRELSGVEIRTASPVRAIVASKDGSTRVVSDAGDVQASFVCVCAPLTIMQRGKIKFDPPLEARRQVALNSYGMLRACKLMLRFHGAAPWPHDAHGVIVAHFCIPEFWMRTYVGGKHLCVGYLLGSFADEAVAMGVEALAAKAVDLLEEMYAMGAKDRFEACEMHDWGSVEWVQGAYSFPRPGWRVEDAKILAEPLPGRRVFFAGEHCAFPGSGMTAHAALNSGRRAADDMLIEMRTTTASKL